MAALGIALHLGSDGTHDGSVVTVRWRFDGGTPLMAMNASPEPASAEVERFDAGSDDRHARLGRRKAATRRLVGGNREAASRGL